MLCLSVRQPYPWCIMHGGKDIENRDWPTKVRGRVLIHARKTMTDEDLWYFIEFLRRREIRIPSAFTVRDLLAQRGMIVGSVEIVDCVERSPSAWFVGQYGFVLRDPRPLATPIPWKGRLGFFNVELPEGVAL